MTGLRPEPRDRWQRYTSDRRRQVEEGLPDWWPYLCLVVVVVVVGYLVVQFWGG